MMQKNALQQDSEKNLTFVHTADLHLDSPFRGISENNQELSKYLAKSTFEAFNKIVNLCISKKVDFLLVAGDIYDSDDKSLYAQLKFLDGLKKLDKAGISVFIVHGNHDPLDGWSANLDWPENVKIMSGKTIESISFEKDGRLIANIVGTSYPTKHVRDNLAIKYPKKDKDWPFTIGMLHCSVGQSNEHEPYSPCTIDDLKKLGYDYWAIGHIHIPTIINENNPTIIYSGNPQGRHSGELGPRGCYLVSVDSKGIVSPQFIEIGDIIWHVDEISIEGIDTESGLLNRILDYSELLLKKYDGKSVICRYALTGRGNLHPILAKEGIIESILQYSQEELDTSSQFIWIEQIENRTSYPIDREVLKNREDLISDIINIGDELRGGKSSIHPKRSLKTLFDSPKGRKIIIELDDTDLIDIVDNAERLLLDYLIKEEINEN